VVTIGETLEVRVLRVDMERGRVALSMRKHQPRRQREGQRGRPNHDQAEQGGSFQRDSGRADRGARESSGQERRGGPPSGGRRPGGEQKGAKDDTKVYSRPQSTLGKQSRRVQKALLRPMSKTEQAILSSKPEEARPRQDKPEAKKSEDQSASDEKLPGLLDKLTFASIEKRGEQSEE